jgi:GT2 family glycosyltransferase
MVATIIVNFFCADLTAGAVNSVLTDTPGAHVVVVDNSESPAEAELLKTVLDGRAQLLVNKRNTGFGAACNLGFAATDTDLVMLLNPDARAMPGCIPILAAALHAHPELGAVSPTQWWEPSGRWLLPPAWLPTGIGMWSVEQAWRLPRWARRLSHAYRRLALQAWTAQDEVVRQRALSGGAMMVRRSSALAAGGLFDPAYFMYYEDSDLCLRLRRAGMALALVPRATALHEWSHSAAKIGMMEASKEIYLKQHFEGKGAWAERLSRCTAQPARRSRCNTKPCLICPRPLRCPPNGTPAGCWRSVHHRCWYLRSDSWVKGHQWRCLRH